MTLDEKFIDKIKNCGKNRAHENIHNTHCPSLPCIDKKGNDRESKEGSQDLAYKSFVYHRNIKYSVWNIVIQAMSLNI